MMGHRSKRFKLFTETNLEALLPADNFYRQLEGKLDLSFVRDLVRDLSTVRWAGGRSTPRSSSSCS